jgi:hypothetical protein
MKREADELRAACAELAAALRATLPYRFVAWLTWRLNELVGRASR